MQTVAVVLEQPEQLALRNIELTDAGADDIIVDVEWSGISTGTERLLWSGRMPTFPGMGYPLVPGYETVGRVARSANRDGLCEGDLVFIPGANCYHGARGLFGGASSRVVVAGRKATPVDGNIERVVTRLFAVEESLPAAKPKIQAFAATLTPDQRAGDFAQAMMDLGATICTPKRPACSLCPWIEPCLAQKRGDQETFPRKSEKAEGKLRRGAAFVVTRADGALLARTRPDKGLLAKMTEVPTTEWSHDFDEGNAQAAAPIDAQWRRLPGAVRHVFTHFPLELTVFHARVAKSTRAPKGMRFIASDEIESEAFPNVMRKVIAHAAVV